MKFSSWLHARLAESEKPRRRVGIADRKVFARLESFCAYLQNWLKINSKHSISLEGFQTVWKYIGQLGKFPEGLESFHTVWKVFGQSGEFPDTLESFRRVWKVSGQSGKFPDSLESFRTVWNFFGQSGRFSTNLKSFWTAWKVSGQFGRFTTNLQTPEVQGVFCDCRPPPKSSWYRKVNIG